MSYSSEVLSEANLMAYYRLAGITDSTGTKGSLNSVGVNFGGGSLLVGDSNASATFPGGTAQRAHIDHLSSGGWPESIRAIEAIIRPQSTAAGNRFAVTRGWSNGANDFAMLLLVDGSNIYAQCTLSTGTVYTVTGPTFIANSKWHCVVAHDGTTLFLYVNGYLYESIAATGTLKTASWAAVTIGAPSSGQASLEFIGEVDEVALYSSPLNAGRIQKHYQESLQIQQSYGWGTVATLIPSTLTTARFNLATNPRCSALNTNAKNEVGPTSFYWHGSYSNPASGGPSDGPASYVRKTINVASPIWEDTKINFMNTNPDSSPISPALDGLNVSASTTYTLSFWVRGSKACTPTVAMREFLSNGANNLYPTYTTAAISANTWTRVFVTFTTAANTAIIAGNIGGNGTWANGDTWDVTGVLLEQTSLLKDYFDGTMANCAWAGTANDSRSTQIL